MSNTFFTECEGLDKCPCCGTTPDMIKYTSPFHIKDDQYWITCPKCLIRTKKTNNKYTLKKSWNRRKDLTKVK